MNPISTFFSILNNALKALTAYFELMRETAYARATREHLQEKDEIRNKIIKLRNEGTIDSTDRADLLMLQLEERERHWKRVSAAYSRHHGGNSDSN
jgi:hypothetical protein